MDKMEKLSLRAMQLLILLGIVFWIVIGAVLLKDLMTDDVVGYTEHGHEIRESDLEEYNE
tara:strand:+ start:719 stop:898 length:180 start_codon:yes stop_codon:yes gene_type:complete